MIYDVIVLGGGAAGLAAGRAAADAGASVVVLEARELPGGRMRTARVVGLGAIDLGAEFVHGKASVTTELVRGTKARKLRARGRHYQAAVGGPEKMGGQWKDLGRVLERVEAGRDRSVASAIAAVDAKAEAKRFALGYLTGFHALDPDRASIHAMLAEEGG